MSLAKHLHDKYWQLMISFAIYRRKMVYIYDWCGIYKE